MQIIRDGIAISRRTIMEISAFLSLYLGNSNFPMTAPSFGKQVHEEVGGIQFVVVGESCQWSMKIQGIEYIC